MFTASLVSCVAAVAQDRQPGRSNHSPYQIPQTVYVGDRAMLVMPLPEQELAADIELNVQFPLPDDIEIHRIALESRQAGSRLVVEFTAFTPGTFYLPSFEAEGMRFSGLHFNISSIIEGDTQPVLSALAPPLSVPGTGFFIYGVISALVLLLLAAIWAWVWGRHYFRRWISVWKRRQLINLMEGIEKRMRKALAAGKSRQLILDTVSVEFRNFLSLFTGRNCRAMTACEFGQSPQLELFAALPADWNSGFLTQYFRRCDTLRFGGTEIDNSAVLALLGELRDFLAALYKAVQEDIKREKTDQEKSKQEKGAA